MDDSSSDTQYIDDIECIDEYVEDEIFVLDIEDKKIAELTKTMNNYKLRLSNFASESLYNISDIKRSFYLLCENNRYLIDDSTFLSNLESLISKDILHYEEQLFMLSEQLVDKEIEEENRMTQQKISCDKVKETHERLIYGEKLANERKLLRERANII